MFSQSFFPFAALLGIVAAAPGAPQGCAYEKCLYSAAIPTQWKSAASAFCQVLLRTSIKPITTTTTIPVKSTVTVVPQPVICSTTVTASITAFATATSLNTETITATSTTSGTCPGTTVTVPASTFIYYPAINGNPNPRKRYVEEDTEKRSVEVFDILQNDIAKLNHSHLEERQIPYGMPGFFTNGCRSPAPIAKVKNACSCFLTRPVITATTTKIWATTITAPAITNTATATITVMITVTVTAVESATMTVTTSTSTCTSTVDVKITAPGSCGGVAAVATASTSASVTCSAAAPAGSINALHRIEGNDVDGTIFEGCVVAGPRSITTPSGGTHQCGASTGTSITGQTDQAGKDNDFTYDGTYSPSFNDYFITRIGNTAQNGNQYWGVLNNGVFTTSGGCGAQVRTGDRSLWAWDAFSPGRILLSVYPEYVAALAGQGTVTVTVSGRSPNGGGSSPFAGASLNGQTSDSSGQVTFAVPAVPGCYQYKATSNGNTRSNALYINVQSSFASGGA
ncbi:Hypothetical protein D9617_22g065890 [Elsinoe fawcettii]|nr:Hypothetical protein D9617_22g065890 [Elsinoe fawcettii]